MPAPKPRGTHSSMRSHAAAEPGSAALPDLGFAARTVRIPTYTELYYSDPIHIANAGLEALRESSRQSLSLEYRQCGWEGGLRAFACLADDLIE